MSKQDIFIGSSRLQSASQEVKGEFVSLDGERYYCITGYQNMPDFFMSVVSDSDHFMFISSNGALTAGRKDKNNALFPYYTDDKIHDYRGKTGSRTIILVQGPQGRKLWEPFTVSGERHYTLQRKLYKSIYGNKLIFEELNEELGICFRYGWYNSERYGIIKKASIVNLRDERQEFSILDGLRNILPAGADYHFQNEYSNLLTAYRKNERVQGSSLGLFSLSSIPVDRPEPSEALRTTSVWSTAPEDARILLSDLQVELFMRGESIANEFDIRASNGAYYISFPATLKKDEKMEWLFAAEINQDSSQVNDLLQHLRSARDITSLIDQDIRKGTEQLTRIVGSCDGIQAGREELVTARHFSNAMFNVMRGGVFQRGYQVELRDLIHYLEQTNRAIRERYGSWLSSLGTHIPYQELIRLTAEKNDPDLQRICMEYLPLTFSRRHGDPSRPWNFFSIENRNPDGSEKLNYEGNWRDIFQNWEALGLSFPGYLEGMIAKFVNASTADGYNPYRITREGVDWEVQDPDDPWAFIGYWGDHQIIYLLKLLEHSEAFHPGLLDQMLAEDLFVYAHVPYAIKGFRELTQDPKNTIIFDHEADRQLKKLAVESGADGKLLRDNKGQIIHANLTEKLLASLLAKLSNFIPEAGIWLNTQRPEWNDANNALVGYGASMVTLYYIRRFLEFWKEQLERTAQARFEVAEELETFLASVHGVFGKHRQSLPGGFSDRERMEITGELGLAGEAYRTKIYRNAFSGKRRKMEAGELLDFINLSLAFVDQSIRANKRKDKLYHAYNLVSFSEEGVSIRYLYEMLEGQVAVLSAGLLSARESLEVLDALKESRLFREDQYSYILYPDRELPRFTEKNVLSTEQADRSRLLVKLLQQEDPSIVIKDAAGRIHFNSGFRNAGLLEEALGKLPGEPYGSLVQEEKQLVLDIYEEVFDHQSFTGRSGTFYGYEGLGSIYWHMVSKLLLAVQECHSDSIKRQAGEEISGRLMAHYYEIKAGIGIYKSPELYGAFPTDAYSHTPGGAGVKQPGLTGQVKEDIITRFSELGLRVEKGSIRFSPSLLKRDELLDRAAKFDFINQEGQEESLELTAGQLAFTYCQVPVILSSGLKAGIRIRYKSGEEVLIEGNEIPGEISEQIFKRTGKVSRIEYMFN